MRSFTCAVSVNFSPPYFWYGMLRRCSSISSGSEWCAARNSTAWRLQQHAGLAQLEHAAHDEVGLLVLVVARDDRGPLAAFARGPELLVVALGRARR